VGATWETNEPFHWQTTGEQSVWWKWQAPVSGTVTITTAGSSFDTILAAYTGTSLSSLSLMANNDDYGGNVTSQISFFATANLPACDFIDTAEFPIRVQPPIPH